jgi:hypothetical protein
MALKLQRAVFLDCETLRIRIGSVTYLFFVNDAAGDSIAS